MVDINRYPTNQDTSSVAAPVDFFAGEFDHLHSEEVPVAERHDELPVDYFAGAFDHLRSTIPERDTADASMPEHKNSAAHVVAAGVVLGGAAIILTDNLYNFRNPGQALEAIRSFFS